MTPRSVSRRFSLEKNKAQGVYGTAGAAVAAGQAGGNYGGTGQNAKGGAIYLASGTLSLSDDTFVKTWPWRQGRNRRRREAARAPSRPPALTGGRAAREALAVREPEAALLCRERHV